MTEAEERAVIIVELALTYPVWYENWKRVIAPRTMDDLNIEHLRSALHLWRQHAERVGYPGT